MERAASSLSVNVGFGMAQIASAGPTVVAQALNSSITSGRNFHIVDLLAGFDVLLHLLDVLVFAFEVPAIPNGPEEDTGSRYEGGHQFT